MNGRLDWLARQPEHDECPIVRNADERLPALLDTCKRDGVALPPAFTRFMSDVPLQRRIRSATSCYLDLDTGMVPLDTGGVLIRFLADQQGCLYWYLHILDGGADHGVVCSPEFIDAADAPRVEEPGALCFCAESFEAFICRYWLENEIWFAADDGTPMPDVGATYIRQYRNRP